MLSHKGLFCDQQRQKIRMRHVRNSQYTPDSFIPFSVHLVLRLAGEVPWLTSIPQTAICLQYMALNIASYTGILQISLLTWDIKVHFLNVMSWESFKSRLIMLLRCFILRVHASGESLNDTTRAGGSPLLSMCMHMIFLELTLKKFHKCAKEPGAPGQKASPTGIIGIS